MSFSQDYKKGSKGEQLLIDFLAKSGFEAFLNKDMSKKSFFDVYFEQPFISFEVKFDFKSSITGNIAIEYYNPVSNNISGIAVSKADYIVYIVYIKKVPILYFARRKDLIRFMDEVKPFKNVCGGDNNNSYMLLYKKDVALGDPSSDCPLKSYSPEEFAKELGENIVLRISPVEN